MTKNFCDVCGKEMTVDDTLPSPCWQATLRTIKGDEVRIRLGVIAYDFAPPLDLCAVCVKAAVSGGEWRPYERAGKWEDDK